MPRPKSSDPKQPVTLRLPASVLARYEAMGDGWRIKAEAVLEAHVKPAPPIVVVAKPRPVKPFVSRLKGEWKAP